MIVGIGTVIYNEHLSNINATATIGKNCKVHSHVWIGNNVKIGDNCKIEAFCFIPDGVEIGHNVFLGPRVTFTNDKYPPSFGKGWLDTFVEDGVSIGAGAVILPGIRLDKGCRIGAGAVVTKNVPADEVWVGNPARKLK